MKHQINIFTHSVFSSYPPTIQFERENEMERQRLFEYLLPMDHSLLNSHSEEPFNNSRFVLLLVQFSYFCPVSFLLVVTSRFLYTLVTLSQQMNNHSSKKQ